MSVGLILWALPFIFLLLWGMQYDRDREKEKEWSDIFAALYEKELSRKNRTSEEHALQAVLNIEKKLLDQYFDYRHMVYGDYVTDVVLGKIKLKE